MSLFLWNDPLYSPREALWESFPQTRFDAELFDLLRRHDAAFGVVEKEDDGKGTEPPREVTGSFVYMRLRKGAYSAGEMHDWACWISSQTVPVYCYLKHDDLAPVLANDLMKALAEL